MDDVPFIDAHHHLWDLRGGRLRYPWLETPASHPHFLGNVAPLPLVYLPAEHRQHAAHHRIVASVHVEAECDRTQQVEETRWLHEMHEQHGLPNAIVAHAWFHTGDAESIIATQASFPLVRGIRSKPVTRPTPGARLPRLAGSMQDPAWRRGYALLEHYGLSWDLRVPAWHLEEAADVLREYPRISAVLNHTGFPWDRSTEGLAMWRRGMHALAALPNCYCKLSCLCLLDGQWDYGDNSRVVLEAIDIFGVERCMFASNFPVDGLRVPFARMFDDFKNMTAGLGRANQLALFHDNAKRFYRI